VLQLVVNGVVGEKRRKLVQFVTLFCIVQHGRPMLENEAHKELFEFFELENNLKLHWIDFMSWAMVQHMHQIVFSAT
jgi:hypothetical protein